MRQIWLVSAPALLDQLFFPISFHFFSLFTFILHIIMPQNECALTLRAIISKYLLIFIFFSSIFYIFQLFVNPFLITMAQFFLNVFLVTLHINSSHHYAADRVRPHFESNYTTAANHSNKPLQVPPNWIKTNIESNIRCQSKNWISNICKTIGNYTAPPPNRKKSAK